MHKTLWALYDGRNGKRRSAATAWIDSEEDVLRVKSRIARAVDNGRNLAVDHIFNVLLRKRLLAAQQTETWRV